MQIVINKGANMPANAARHYGIALAPSHILVDGKEYDAGSRITHEQLDSWVKTARDFPYVVGTTAHEFVQVFTEAAKTENEILVVTASKKLIQTYQAATAAARTMKERSAYASIKISIVDSGVMDLPASLLTMVAGEARLAGLPLRTTAGILETLATRTAFCGYVDTLDNLVRGGRAGFLRAWIADFLDIKPILGIHDGELRSTGKIRGSGDFVRAMTEQLATAGERRRVWACIAHGSALDRAEELADSIRRTFDVAYLLVMEQNPSVYLHAGRGSVIASVFPIDDLSWEPPTPKL
ncbi:MAG: DegV family protein [Polyangiaceae bacterium]